MAKQKSKAVAKANNTSSDKVEELKFVLDGLLSQLAPLNDSLSAEPTNENLQAQVKAMQEKVDAAQANYDTAVAKALADGSESLVTVNDDDTFTHSDVPDVMLQIAVPALNFGGSIGIVSKEAIMNNEKLLDALVQAQMVDGKIVEGGSIKIIA